MPKKTRKTDESDPRWATMGLLADQPWMLSLWLSDAPPAKAKRRRKTSKKASKW